MNLLYYVDNAQLFCSQFKAYCLYFVFLYSSMRFYSLWALLKVIFGLAMMWVIYNHVHVYQQPIIGLSLWFLAVFLSVWWGSYFFFLLCYKLFSKRMEQRQNSESYTHSLLLAVRTMVQLSLMITNNRSYFFAGITIAIFLVLHISIVHETAKSTT